MSEFQQGLVHVADGVLEHNTHGRNGFLVLFREQMAHIDPFRLWLGRAAAAVLCGWRHRSHPVLGDVAKDVVYPANKPEHVEEVHEPGVHHDGTGSMDYHISCGPSSSPLPLAVCRAPFLALD